MAKTIFEKIKSKNYSFALPEKKGYKTHVLKFKSFLEENNLELNEDSLQKFFYQFESINTLRVLSAALQESMRSSITDDFDLYLLKQTFAETNTWYRENKIPRPIQNPHFIPEENFKKLISHLRFSKKRNDRIFSLAFELIRFLKIEHSVIRSLQRVPIRDDGNFVFVKGKLRGKEKLFPIPKKIFLEIWENSNYDLDDLDKSTISAVQKLGTGCFEPILAHVKNETVLDRSNWYLFEFQRKTKIGRSTLEKKFSSIYKKLFGLTRTLHDLAHGKEKEIVHSLPDELMVAMD